jgi:methylated-DNA-[protein]-cysteine S-methyltransferase
MSLALTPNRRGECFATFESPIGVCAIGWSERGITALHLPEKSTEAICDSLRQRRGEDIIEADMPQWVRAIVLRICSLLSGQKCSLADVPLDFEGLPPFHQEVYRAALHIPFGQTRTYGQLARMAGSDNGARAVGQAMAKNPFALIVPCHRVLGANGNPGGFSAFGGCESKRKLLQIEGNDLGRKAT